MFNVMITGATGTLGEACKRTLNGHGCDVHGFSRSTGQDVRDYPALARGVADRLGERQLDGLVTCAGICRVSPFEDASMNDLMETLAVNVGGTWNAIRVALDHGVRRIVTVGSLLGSFPLGYPDRASYITSKAAVAGMTRALAVELAPRKVAVNCVAPGHFSLMDAKGGGLLAGAQGKSPMDMVTASEVADVISWLLCYAPLTVTGQTIVIDGGYTLNQFPISWWWNDADEEA